MLVNESSPLMEFLLKAVHGVKRSTIKDYLTQRSVFVNGKPVTQYNHPLQPGDQVHIQRDKVKAQAERLRSDLDILYEDDDVIAVNKPSGLLTVATEKEKTRTIFYQVYEYLKIKAKPSASKPVGRRAQESERLLYIVHRLDQDASGVLILAKTLDAKIYLQENWHDFEKKYYAVVEGTPREPSGKIESYLKENEILRVFSSPTEIRDSKYALTYYQTLESMAKRSLLEVTLMTGRKHQIRVHMALIGCPILGDRDYGNKDLARRMALHSFSLTVRHPVTHQRLNFTTEMPQDLKVLIQRR